MAGLYVHVPFCLQKCAYCDFISYPCLELADRYIEVLLTEARVRKQLVKDPVTTIFIGGGTPTALSPSLLSTLLGELRSLFAVTAGTEWTVEMNPGTVDEAKLTVLRDCGVNRLSIGVQAAQDGLLKRLGRIHSFRQAQETFCLAQRYGFDNMNVDLMYAIPGQTVADWQNTLQTVIAWQPAHISAYSLIIEPGTPFWDDCRQGKLQFPDEDVAADMMEITLDLLTQHGYAQYEVSNFAQPGRQCQHNLGYWRYQNFIGLGCAATGFEYPRRWVNRRDVRAYIAGHTLADWTEETEVLTAETAMGEMMFMGLRMISGVDQAAFRRRFGVSVHDVYGPQIRKLIQDGLLKEDDRSLYLTADGMMKGNVVFMNFV